ncbi:hypothetical protein JXB12_04855 [candidate division KSB1 bacterium]|nr:hypothetical protein [candidate division KSB1 bacterium]
MTEKNIEQTIEQIISSVYNKFSQSNLYEYVNRHEIFLDLEHYELSSIWNLRDLLQVHPQTNKLIERAARICAAKFKYFVYKNNQFIYFDRETESLIKSEYIDFLEFVLDCLLASFSVTTFTNHFFAALVNHQNQMRFILKNRTFLDDDEYFLKYLLKPTISEDYSAEFQLDLFNIDPTHLMQPVLDLGCGLKGDLVNYLDQIGMQVIGIDRIAPSGDNFVTRDWFHFDYRSDFWGTIIAHQSLSTHFIFSHSTSASLAQKYAKLMMKIIEGLKIGGKFYYAPGLPFFEEHLDEKSSILIEKIPVDLSVDIQGVNEIAYAVELTRLQ